METLSRWIRQSQSVLRWEGDAYGQVLVTAFSSMWNPPKPLWRFRYFTGVEGQNLSLGDIAFTVARLGFVATSKIEGDEVWSPWL